MLKLVKEARFYLPSLLFLCLISALEAVFTLAIPFLLSFIINDSFLKRGENTDLSPFVTTFGLIIIALALAIVALCVISNFLSVNLASKIASLIREKCIETLFKFSKLEKNRFSDYQINFIINDDISFVRAYLSTDINLVFYAFFLLVTSLILSFVFSVSAGIIISIAFFLSLSLAFLLVLFLLPQIKERINLNKSIKSKIKQNENDESLKENLVQKESKNSFISRYFALFNTAILLVLSIIVVALSFFLARFVQENSINSSHILSLSLFALLSASSIFALANAFRRSIKANDTLLEIYDFINTHLSIVTPCLPIEVPKDSKYSNNAISFNNVSFSYENEEAKVLDNISFNVKRGEIVAITANNTSDKSVIFDLIMRFFDANEGYVMVNGVDVRDCDLDDLRSNISLCYENPELLTTTIIDNIYYAVTNASVREVKRITRLTTAHDCIIKQRMAYNGYIVNRGKYLSNQDANSLCLARTLLKKANIFLIDDIFKNFDKSRINKIKNELIRHIKMQKASAIIITDRAEILSLVDKVIVLDNGKIKDDENDSLVSEINSKIETEKKLEKERKRKHFHLGKLNLCKDKKYKNHTNEAFDRIKNAKTDHGINPSDKQLTLEGMRNYFGSDDLNKIFMSQKEYENFNGSELNDNYSEEEILEYEDVEDENIVKKREKKKKKEKAKKEKKDKKVKAKKDKKKKTKAQKEEKIKEKSAKTKLESKDKKSIDTKNEENLDKKIETNQNKKAKNDAINTIDSENENTKNIHQDSTDIVSSLLDQYLEENENTYDDLETADSIDDFYGVNDVISDVLDKILEDEATENEAEFTEENAQENEEETSLEDESKSETEETEAEEEEADLEDENAVEEVEEIDDSDIEVLDFDESEDAEILEEELEKENEEILDETEESSAEAEDETEEETSEELEQIDDLDIEILDFDESDDTNAFEDDEILDENEASEDEENSTEDDDESEIDVDSIDDDLIDVLDFEVDDLSDENSENFDVSDSEQAIKSFDVGEKETKSSYSSIGTYDNSQSSATAAPVIKEFAPKEVIKMKKHDVPMERIKAPTKKNISYADGKSMQSVEESFKEAKLASNNDESKVLETEESKDNLTKSNEERKTINISGFNQDRNKEKIEDEEEIVEVVESGISYESVTESEKTEVKPSNYSSFIEARKKMLDKASKHESVKMVSYKSDSEDKNTKSETIIDNKISENENKIEEKIINNVTSDEKEITINQNIDDLDAFADDFINKIKQKDDAKTENSEIKNADKTKENEEETSVYDENALKLIDDEIKQIEESQKEEEFADSEETKEAEAQSEQTEEISEEDEAEKTSEEAEEVEEISDEEEVSELESRVSELLESLDKEEAEEKQEESKENIEDEENELPELESANFGVVDVKKGEYDYDFGPVDVKETELDFGPVDVKENRVEVEKSDALGKLAFDFTDNIDLRLSIEQALIELRLTHDEDDSFDNALASEFNSVIEKTSGENRDKIKRNTALQEDNRDFDNNIKVSAEKQINFSDDKLKNPTEPKKYERPKIQPANEQSFEKESILDKMHKAKKDAPEEKPKARNDILDRMHKSRSGDVEVAPVTKPVAKPIPEVSKTLIKAENVVNVSTATETAETKEKTPWERYKEQQALIKKQNEMAMQNQNNAQSQVPTNSAQSAFANPTTANTASFNMLNQQNAQGQNIPANPMNPSAQANLQNQMYNTNQQAYQNPYANYMQQMSSQQIGINPQNPYVNYNGNIPAQNMQNPMYNQAFGQQNLASQNSQNAQNPNNNEQNKN